MGEAGTTFKVVHHEGDPTGLESAPTVVNGFGKDGGSSSELADFCFNLLLLFFPLSIAYNFSIGLPVRQLVKGFSEGIEPCSWAAEQLKQPHPYGVSWDA